MSFDISARGVGVTLSRAARTLLSPRAMNDLVRQALVHGGDEWISTWLPRRFQRGYAALLGYVTSQRRDPWAARRNLPPTYDERKRELQGHQDPLVWTGRLRAQVLAQARAVATATRGNARGRITFGRVAVGSAATGWRAPPRLVVSTLLGGPSRRLPVAEVATVRDGFLGYVVAALTGLAEPTRKPLPVPQPIVDRRREHLAAHLQRRAESERAAADIGTRARDRRLRAMDRLDRWRADAGGSSPVDAPAMTATERRVRHAGQSLASYHRRRHVINPRRRLRRRGAL